MRKESTIEAAREEAKARNHWYGWSVFSPGWFVGTKEQLIAIGVHTPIKG